MAHQLEEVGRNYPAGKVNMKEAVGKTRSKRRVAYVQATSISIAVLCLAFFLIGGQGVSISDLIIPLPFLIGSFSSLLILMRTKPGEFENHRNVGRCIVVMAVFASILVVIAWFVFGGYKLIYSTLRSWGLVG